MGRGRDLRLEDAVPILSRYPGIGAPTCIRRAPGGTANANYAVEATSGRYFLRRRNPRYAGEDAITFDHRLMEHLAGHGIAVTLAREVDGMPGRRWLQLDAANVVELYPWRDGDAFDQHHQRHLVAAGDALGRFHAMTRRFVRPVGKEWGRYDNPSTPNVVRARWLACRIDGMRKVPPEQRLSYVLADVDGPLRWLDERSMDLVRTSACATRAPRECGTGPCHDSPAFL